MATWTKSADAGIYPFRVDVGFRHLDLDVQKLITNVAIAECFEEGRTKYSIDRRLKGAFDPHRRILSELRIWYGEDAKYPGGVQVSVGVGAITENSWTLHLLATQEKRCVARCESQFQLLSGDQLVALPDGLAQILRKDLIDVGHDA